MIGSAAADAFRMLGDKNRIKIFIELLREVSRTLGTRSRRETELGYSPGKVEWRTLRDERAVRDLDVVPVTAWIVPVARPEGARG